jgi:hypothetical protein
MHDFLELCPMDDFSYICENSTQLMEKSHKTSAELFAAQALASQVRNELTQNILPYWMQKMSRPDGGFYGRINGNEDIDPEAPI